VRREGGSDKLADGLARGEWRHLPLEEADQAMLAYTEKLTIEPSTIAHADADRLREAGFSDAEIGDIALTIAFFAYMNRIVDGLGAHISRGVEAEARRLGVWRAGPA
jgi:uncharacterized peroxidase-related enzyme